MPNAKAVPQSLGAHKESFEEWQARVFALDTAIREHLAPRGQQDWRYLDVPVLLKTWKERRCQHSYLNLFERLMRMLELFARAGSMSPEVVYQQLRDCESFLETQPLSGRERTLKISARKAAARVAAMKRPASPVQSRVHHGQE